MSRVRYQGRWVSSHWLKRYVLNGAQPVAPKPKEVHAIYARYFLPAIACIRGDESQMRIMNLNNSRHREWVEDMSGNYAEISKRALTTFFPDHP